MVSPPSESGTSSISTRAPTANRRIAASRSATDRTGVSAPAGTGLRLGFSTQNPQVSRYDLPMTSRSAVWVFVLAALVFGGSIAGSTSGPPAAAEQGLPMDQPPEDPADSSCSFTLSPPQLTTLPGGARAVTATLAVSACSGHAQAASSTICVSAPDGPNDCATTPAWNPAQVFVTASKLTGRFTATAKGCWQVTSVMGGNYTCAPLGPVITTI